MAWFSDMITEDLNRTVARMREQGLDTSRAERFLSIRARFVAPPANQSALVSESLPEASTIESPATQP